MTILFQEYLLTPASWTFLLITSPTGTPERICIVLISVAGYSASFKVKDGKIAYLSCRIDLFFILFFPKRF